MTQVTINEQTPQGKGLLSLIKTMPKKVVTLDDDDLSDCISFHGTSFLRLISTSRLVLHPLHNPLKAAILIIYTDTILFI